MKKTKKMKESKSYCLKDYKNHHYWESKGVFQRERTGTIFQVLKCTQCEKIILEKLEEITRVFQ